MRARHDGPNTQPSDDRASASNTADVLALSTVPVIFGPGTIMQLGPRAAQLGLRHALLVSDPGVVAAGYPRAAAESLRAHGVKTTLFDRVEENPSTRHVADGLAVAQHAHIDSLVAVGGGSAMDCAKGISLLLSNGGNMSDYRGDPPLPVLERRRPLTPLICIPTTAGTGSEAQSFALISDPGTHAKMACGDRRPPGIGLRPAIAILDSDLTRTQPRGVAASAGIDAIAHAVETAGCRVRTAESQRLSVEAWRRLSRACPRALANPGDDESRADMLIGAHLAGAAIERSMLGAAHACANPLTAVFGITHGTAVGLMLPHVIRFNARVAPFGDAGGSVANPYEALGEAQALARTIQRLLAAAQLPQRLRDLAIDEAALERIAQAAAEQWTAGFNPRPVGVKELREIYQAAL